MLPRNSHVQFHRFLYFFICQTAGGYGTIKDFFEARSHVVRIPERGPVEQTTNSSGSGTEGVLFPVIVGNAGNAMMAPLGPTTIDPRGRTKPMSSGFSWHNLLMAFSRKGLGGTRPSARRTRRKDGPCFRPYLEGLEQRLILPISAGTLALLEGPAGGTDSDLAAATGSWGDGQCFVAAHHDQRHGQRPGQLDLRYQQWCHVQRHLDHRRPDADSHPGRQ